MNIEMIRIRNNRGLSLQVDNEVKRINSHDLMDRIFDLNTSLDELSRINDDPNSEVDDYARNIAKSITLILDMFNEMGIYPDYFYDIYFRINNEYRDSQSKGEIKGGQSLYDVPGYGARISRMMENGIKANNYKLNPTGVKNIGDYYNEMIAFDYKHHLPCEITTVEMCREMFSEIKTECGNCINFLGMRPYISDDIENLVRVLFEYISFFAAIGINPKGYVDRELENMEVKGSSK